MLRRRGGGFQFRTFLTFYSLLSSDELITHEPRDNIKDGDVIQLVHGLSGRALNSHDIAAPVSPYNQEVSCYIDYNISMVAQNFWQVKLLNGDDTGGYWHAINSRLQLIHLNSSQALKVSLNVFAFIRNGL